MKFEIGKTIDSQEPFELDIANIVTGRTFIASITRWGKSWTCRKIVEKCFGYAGIIILDPEGEYSSLREKFSFLIIGKDIPLQLETAEFMAEKMLESKINVIIDTSMVEDDETAKEYINLFLRKFFFLETSLRQPYLVVVEEAEDFCGERGIGTETTLRILINIVKKGGKRGIGALFVAHRPAWVSKGILSQCSDKAIGKIESTDFEALEKYARVPKEVIERLPSLGKGEFCFVGDWIADATFVKVGPVQTTHLGRTPDIIPPSPKELQTVIANLQKSLPEIIERIKPTVVPIDELKAKLKIELEDKYKDRIESVHRTADEKAERKYKAKIDELKEHIEKLSRSEVLQPTSPISDVLEHPIVKTRMLELSDKARDLLTRVEREPGLTREQLAAFLTTSTNSIASTVETVNRVFHATAIIGEGKPLKYRSMLKRLFITDVAKREIEEIQRLQNALREKSETANTLQPQVIQLRRETSDLSMELRKAKALLEEVQSRLSYTGAENEKLKNQIKDLEVTAKAGQALNTAINQILDHRLKEVQPTNAPTNSLQKASIDEQEILELIDKRLATLPTPDPSNISTSVSLNHKVTHFDFQKQEEHVTADTTALQGRIIFLITKGWFDQRHNRNEVVTELSNNGWNHDKNEVDSVLLELCQKGIFYRKISTGNVFWYSLQSEAKEKIHA
jgi:uncharacterized protein YoxC